MDEFGQSIHFTPTFLEQAATIEAGLRKDLVNERTGQRPQDCVVGVWRWDGARANAGQVADALVRSLGYVSIADDEQEWQPIERWWAGCVLQRVVSQGLAYDTRFRDDSAGELIAQQFLDCFSRGSVFLSNGDDQTSPRDGSRGGISRATFEKGVIAVDARIVGILWVFDED